MKNIAIDCTSRCGNTCSGAHSFLSFVSRCLPFYAIHPIFCGPKWPWPSCKPSGFGRSEPRAGLSFTSLRDSGIVFLWFSQDDTDVMQTASCALWRGRYWRHRRHSPRRLGGGEAGLEMSKRAAAISIACSAGGQGHAADPTIIGRRDSQQDAKVDDPTTHTGNGWSSHQILVSAGGLCVTQHSTVIDAMLNVVTRWCGIESPAWIAQRALRGCCLHVGAPDVVCAFKVASASVHLMKAIFNSTVTTHYYLNFCSNELVYFSFSSPFRKSSM